jgi:hypothetical protein
MSNIIEVFISYSKQDKELRDGLLAHLRPLEAKGVLIWHDHQILPGTEWDEEIKARLNTADIILLLISADFLNTNYCNQVEIPEALRRHAAGEAIVMPIILRHCTWDLTPLAKIQAYPEKAKPIKSWVDIDEAYTDVVRGVYLAAIEIKKRRDQQQQVKEQESVKQEKTEWEQTQRERREEDWEKQLIRRAARKDLQECDLTRLLFIKNVKDPRRWAYSLDLMNHPASRTFELWWRSGSRGSQTPLIGDLMILHQRARVTHIVEFLDNQVHQSDSGLLRWVRTVWMPESSDWYQLPHQQEILGFSPNYADGNTHSFKSLDFSTFRAAWSNLEEFQKHVVKKLIQSKEDVIDEDDLASENGVDYSRLRDFLKAKQWREADQETANRMVEALGQQSSVLLGSEAIRNFPITDLRTIDSLWIKYSDGKFGFSVQRRILNETFRDSKVTPETCLYDNESLKTVEDVADRLTKRWCTFGKKLGWFEQDQWIMVVDYTQHVTKKPEGYLPLLGDCPKFYTASTSRRPMPWWWVLLLHLEPWKS